MMIIPTYVSYPLLTAASAVAVQEWMTVIDAAIQGVPEQAKRRLRTVTNHFSIRKPQGKSMREPSTSEISESLEERGLDLMESSSFHAEDVFTTAGATASIDTR